MAMNGYHVRGFLSGLSASKMAEKTLKMMHARVALPRQKQMKIFKKIGNLIRSDRWLTIRAIAETVGIDKECVRQISYAKSVCENGA